MNVHRFTAATARDALALVKVALGPEAMILANKNVGDQVEIMACSEEDFAAILSPSTQFQERAPSVNVPSTLDSEKLDHMAGEIRAMRDSLENQIAGISWSGAPTRPPEQVGTLKELLALGFSAGLARYLTENAPPHATVEERLQWAKDILTRNLSVLHNEDDLLERGGVYALVGPTGVGKTTTTAKLAARCVMRHGPGQLALITTDAYRIGAHEQLRIYGKILGVIVLSVKDEVDLQIALEELQNKHTILIDTVGMSQRDQMVAEQIAMLSGTKVPVKRLLCLNSTSTIETLNEVINAYRGSGLEGCILTKLDEAPSVSNALDAVLRQKLRLYYLGTGQRVPEDLEVANPEQLVEKVFSKPVRSQARRFETSELAILMSSEDVRNDMSARSLKID
jgi:flagellar biosynthesis protein FlhF